MSDSVGSVCCKEEIKGTEYECACQKCDLILPVKIKRVKKDRELSYGEKMASGDYVGPQDPNCWYEKALD